MTLRYGILVLALLSALTACQSSQKATVERQIVPAASEEPLARQLDRNIDKALGVWTDPAAEKFLNSVVAGIAASDPNYESVKSARVHLLGSSVPYVAPGFQNTIYVSRGAIAAVLYENELAFLLATQLALVKDGAASKNLAALRGQEVGESIIKLPTAPPPIQRDYLAGDWFEGGGLFDFGSVEYLRAEQEAVRLIYSAKYDPRGAVTLIQRWSEPPLDRETRTLGKILPDSKERLASARAEVAKLSPLRDPIVKSRAFEDLEASLEIKRAKNKRKTESK